jgi:hypothetical protein
MLFRLATSIGASTRTGERRLASPVANCWKCGSCIECDKIPDYRGENKTKNKQSQSWLKPSAKTAIFKTSATKLQQNPKLKQTKPLYPLMNKGFIIKMQHNVNGINDNEKNWLKFVFSTCIGRNSSS